MDPCFVPRWQFIKQTLENLNYADFLEACNQDESSVIIDARTQEEYDMGHLPGAINIDYLAPDLVDLLEQLDPKSNYYVYCKTSRRSVRICVLLRNLGFENVCNLAEGMKDYLTDMTDHKIQL